MNLEDAFRAFNRLGLSMESRFEKPRIRHLGKENPPCPYDPEFIAREWASAWASDDFMSYTGRPGIETSTNEWRREYERLLSREGKR